MADNISNFIAAISSAAAALSAFAAFRAVRETAAQREASYRPVLVFQQQQYSSKQIDGASAPMDGPEVELINVGLGSAKQVRISWQIPKELIENTKSLSKERGYKFEYNRIGENDCALHLVTSFGEVAFGDQIGSLKAQDYDYILPISEGRSPDKVKLPFDYFWLCKAYALSLVNIGFPRDIPPLEVIIRYTDLGNKPHTVTYNMHLEVLGMAAENDVYDVFGILRFREADQQLLAFSAREPTPTMSGPLPRDGID